MKRRMLIISGEAWRDESNGGNVLSNLFDSFKDDYEFAQIYTNPALPSNAICLKYFHLSESEMLQTVFKRKPFGKILTLKELHQEEVNKPYVTSHRFSFVRKYLLNTAFLAQDILWRFSKWKTPELEKFILDFNPDVIFAPMYYGIHLHRLNRYVAQLTGKQLISYVSDDHLTFKQFSLSPIYWVNRLILRNNVKHTAKYYSLLYTMTQEQLNEYQPVLQVPMKLLKKTGDFTSKPNFKDFNEKPIVLFYGGNLIYNRYKTLAKLAEVIQKLNEETMHFQLLIASQTPITEHINKLLNDGKNSILLGKLNSVQMQEYYQLADIVLHVESFDLKQRLLTRLSFSTKIIDLLHTGRCVMAICWRESSPYKYLKSEHAAICVDDFCTLEEELKNLIKNPKIMHHYANQAWNCGERNHNKEKVIADFRKDIELLIS